MIINKSHILTVSRPLETFTDKNNGMKINQPHILIRFINKDFTVVFFKSIALAKLEFDYIKESINEFIEIDMEFTESIFNKKDYIQFPKSQMVI